MAGVVDERPHRIAGVIRCVAPIGWWGRWGTTTEDWKDFSVCSNEESGNNCGHATNSKEIVHAEMKNKE